MNDLLKILEEESEGDSLYEKEEDFNPYDSFGGNMDDAYWGGVADGRRQLAKELMLTILNSK